MLQSMIRIVDVFRLNFFAGIMNSKTEREAYYGI